MKRSAALNELQQTDNEIDARTQRVAELTRMLGETEELKAANKRLESAWEMLGHLRVSQRDYELSIQGLEQKKRVSEQKLYSGKIRNPKELTDLQDKIASLERHRQSIEDELLEVLVNIEETEQEEQQATQEWDRIEGEWISSQANTHAEKELQEAKLVELSNLRQDQISRISPGDLEQYEYIRQRKGGQAVALLKGSECQGCMTGVSAARVLQARRDELATCGTCGRILHIG